MIQTSVFIVAGLALLAVGGDVLVRGAVRVAATLGVSRLLVGLVVVGFGTSTPELATSLIAAFKESPGLVVGNVIGSNIANILLILGVASCTVPLALRRGAFLRDVTAMLLASFAAATVIVIGVASQLAGAVLALLLLVYLVIAYRGERSKPVPIAPEDVTTGASITASARNSREIMVALGLAALGIAATLAGAHLLVTGAIDVATRSGVSQAVIGLTIVAVGTSLPELVACMVAALHRHPEVAIGNVLGSCIYNVFGVLGFTALIHPLQVPTSIAGTDVLALLGSAVLLSVFLLRGKTLGRLAGAGFILLYAGYLGTLLNRV